MAERNYVRFGPSRAKRLYTFLYPTGWKPREVAQNGFTEIFIAGPLSESGTYTVSFSVRASSAPAETPQEAATDYISRYRSAFRFKEVGRTSIRVAGSPAVEVEIAYSMPLPLYSAETKQTVIHERRIFLKQGDQLYELIYAAPEGDYETWLGAFQTLVESFAFLEESEERVAYRPVITAAPQYVGEGAVEYKAEEEREEGETE